MQRNANPQNTELAGPPFSAKMGVRRKTAKTPKRATAISRPIAKAISLPLNHFTMVLDTVIPAISTPTPKIANPKNASLADAGIQTINELSQVAKAVASNPAVKA